jgi:hypothetical protein
MVFGTLISSFLGAEPTECGNMWLPIRRFYPRNHANTDFDDEYKSIESLTLISRTLGGVLVVEVGEGIA